MTESTQQTQQAQDQQQPRQAAIVLMYNSTPAQLDLAKLALASVLAQDTPLDILVIDNGSAPETQQWLATIVPPVAHTLTIEHHPENVSPLKLTNAALARFFTSIDPAAGPAGPATSQPAYPCVLTVPSDVILPANCYRELLCWPQDMVGVGMHGTNPPALVDHSQTYRIHGDVHFSVVLTRRTAWDKLLAQDGYFSDEGFFLYASDCDLKVRMARAGVTTAQIENLLAYHYGSASWRLSDPFTSIVMNQQADRDREYFARKHGFSIGSPKYGACIEKLNQSSQLIHPSEGGQP